MTTPSANPAQVTAAVLEQAQGMLNAFAVGREAESTLEYASAVSLGEDGVQARVKDLQAELVKIKTEADDGQGGSDWSKVKSISGTDAEKQNHVILLSSKLNGAQKALYEKRAEAERAEEAERREQAAEMGMGVPGFPMGGGFAVPQIEEIGALVERHMSANYEDLKIGSSAFKAAVKSQKDFEIFNSMPKTHYSKQLMAAVFKTGSWEPNQMYEPGWLPQETEGIQILPHVASGVMPGKNMNYHVETVVNHAAARRAEGAAAAEAEYKLETRQYIPISIAHHVPLTEEALEDRDEIVEYLNYELPLGVLKKLDTQIGAGQGSDVAKDEDFRGITRLGFKRTQTAGVADEPQPKKYAITGAEAERINWDILLRAKKEAMTFGGGILGAQIPSHAFVTTEFWVNALLSKSSAGGYLVGGPDQALLAMPWGMLMVPTTHSFSDAASVDVAAGDDNFADLKYSGCVADMSMRFSKLCYRHGIRVRVGQVNDDFTKFQYRLRADVRAQWVVKRAAAFCMLVNPKDAAGNAPGNYNTLKA